METVGQVSISTCLQDNDEYLKQLLGIGVSWDLIAKPFVFDGVKMTSYTVNGYFLTMNMVLIVENLEMTLKEFVQSHRDHAFAISELVAYLNVTIGFVQVQIVDRMQDAVRYILSGPMVTFLDGYDQALMIDTRIYPMRGIQEPEVERLVRGPRDGFVETMLMNVALIRRRMRDPRLRVELMQLGTRSQTDVSLIYLQDVTSEELVDDVRGRLKALDADVVAMGEQAVTESIGHVAWNPFPITRYTERPDVATQALVEGQIVIVVDTTPEAIVLPTTIFHHIHHIEDYHGYPINGTYMRWVMLVGSLMSVLAPGVFIVLAQNAASVPKWFAPLFIPKNLPLPLGVQFFLAQIGVDLFERAVINTPTALATAIGVVAALVFGQFATMMDLVTPEVLVFMGVAAIAQFAISSHELGAANRLVRLFVITAASTLGIWGYAGSVVVIFLVLAFTKSFGVPYLWPFVPFDWEGFKGLLVRRPLYGPDGRPAIFRPKTPARRG